MVLCLASFTRSFPVNQLEALTLIGDYIAMEKYELGGLLSESVWLIGKCVRVTFIFLSSWPLGEPGLYFENFSVHAGPPQAQHCQSPVVRPRIMAPLEYTCTTLDATCSY